MKQNRMVKILSLGLGLWFLSSCAFNESNSSDENKTYQEDRQKLMDEFSSVVGTYEGYIETLGANDLTNPNSGSAQQVQIPLQLAIYVEEATGGKDSQGQENILPSLKIRYRQMDTVRPDQKLSARFVRETGALNASGSTAGQPDTGITARALGREIVGEINRSGRFGKFRVLLVNKETPAAVDSTQDFVQRKFQLYKSLEGVYEGRVVRPPEFEGAKKTFPVRITMSAVPVIQSGTVVDVNLKGLYRRPDFTADPSAGERFLDISYTLDKDPAQMIMSSKGGTAQIPDAFTMNIIGSLNAEGFFQGQAYDRFGYTGVITLQRKNNR